MCGKAQCVAVYTQEWRDHWRCLSQSPLQEKCPFSPQETTEGMELGFTDSLQEAMSNI